MSTTTRTTTRAGAATAELEARPTAAVKSSKSPPKKRSSTASKSAGAGREREPITHADPDGGELVAEFEKNGREVVRVRLTEYRGNRLVDIRTFYENGSGAWSPGKGIALRRGKLAKLKAALARIEDEPDPDDEEQDAGAEEAAAEETD